MFSTIIVRKKTPFVRKHITSKLIELESPGCLGFEADLMSMYEHNPQSSFQVDTVEDYS